ncbi:MAG TPA: hypothetical protein VG820_11540 [Fimbriimonadaceae bacterium]|nr:hypothetical protein [Fimbriimonadaceae bacterium]
MARTILLVPLAALAIAAYGQKSPVTVSPVGTWKYDVATLRLEPNEAAKRELNDPKRGKQAQEMMQKMKSSLAETLKTMRIAFKADHKLVITSTKLPDKLLGTWSMTGLKIKVIMTDAKQQTPDLALAKDGKHIVATYADPSFGVGKVNLVRG